MTALQEPTPTVTPSAECAYIRNLVALWQWDAALAMALESVSDQRLPQPEPTRDGHATLRVPLAQGGTAATGGGGGGVYLHSRYRPIEEAVRWAEAALKGEDKYVLIVHGFGLGYHVRALFDALPPDAMLIVGEPDLAVLKTALQTTDFSAMLATGRVLIFHTLDRGTLVERLEPRSALLTSGTAFAAHQPSVQVQPQFHQAFGQLITEFVAFARTGYMTMMLNNVVTCRNIANNLGRYVTTPPIDLLHQACASIPAILVAAGPSLAKNMHLLQEVKRGQRHAVIIAVQTMLKPLLAAGIEPDFVTSLDYNTVGTRFFENLDEAGATGKVHLVAEPKAHWNVLDVFAGSMSLTGNDFAAKLLRDADTRLSLKAGATVAHLSFYLAEFLGCEPIILIGQDLGFIDGLYYKPGTAIHETWGVELGRFNSLETKEWERIARSKAILRKIPDIHGHPMYTEEQFFVYLQQFERDFAETRSTVIDATEGGAAKQHVRTMTLRQALDTYCQPAAARPATARPWKTWTCDRGAQLRSALDAMAKRRQECTAMLDVCNQTVPLLEDMIAHQQDAVRMDRLFVEVDRLRSKVGADPETFEVVTQLNTIGELRRFQHDLRVKRQEEHSLERQKHQLLRDVDYVKNLRVGCQRLLTILDEATGRLQRQLAAVDAGEPWPVEVAGSKGAPATGDLSATGGVR